MRPGILFKKEIQDSIRWVTIVSSVLGVLLEIKYENLFILSFFLSTLLISAFGYRFEKKSFFPLIFIGIPWVILVVTFFNITFTNEYILFFIPLQVLTLGGLIYYFCGYLFEYFWNLSNGFVMKRWNRLTAKELNYKYKEIKFGAILLPISHLFLTIKSLMVEKYIFAFEQAGIAFLFFVLFFYFLKYKKSIQKEAKKIAALTFFMFIIMITFDSILSQMLYLANNPFWITVFFSTIVIVIVMFRILINPKSHRFSKTT